MEGRGQPPHNFAVPGLSLAGHLANQSDDGAQDHDGNQDGRRRTSVGNNSEANSSESSYDPATVLLTEIDMVPDPVTQKRKPSPDADTADDHEAKRRRLAVVSPSRDQGSGSSSSTDRSKQLSPEIWHHIFVFVPPRSLGNLLLVNKLFYNYLDPSPITEVSYPQPGTQPVLSTGKSTSNSQTKPLSPLNADSIWRASRQLFWPRMPAPLRSRTEVDMWRLVCSRSCQFCGCKDAGASATSIDPWHRGPGAKGVATVLAFAVVSCGSCLVNRSRKEIDVLLSGETPSVLLPALGSVFLTPERHLLTQQTLQNMDASNKKQLSKLFWIEHLERINAEFESVKQLSTAAAEEWLKGLEARGKLALADVSRWEKWEASGGIRQMRQRTTLAQTQFASTAAPSSGPVSSLQSEGPQEVQNQVAGMAAVDHKYPEAYAGSGMAVLSQAQQRRRTREQARELKQQRKSEIERRAALLNPPLIPAVLAHMASFQAALQISAPLDDGAWELLKNRLLAQREEAEAREKDMRVNFKIEKDSGQRLDQLVPARHPTQVTDEEWNDIQGPVRTRISNYADEIIREGWNNGKSVTKKECSQFAAEVLVYVRKRFYAEVAKDKVAAVAAGRDPVVDPPEGPWTQKLTLENMKWVFDVKIRPHTDKHRKKELFFCNGCSGQLKYYGLEGVTQHYASKHTNVFSLGKHVVHWRAEWPETPPFVPDPKGRRAQLPPKSGQSSSSAAGHTAPQVQPEAASHTGSDGHNGSGALATFVPASINHVFNINPPHHYSNAGDPLPAAHVDASHAAHSIAAPRGDPSPSYPAPTYPHPEVGGLNGPAANDQTCNSFSKPSVDLKYNVRLDYMVTVALQTWRSIGHIQGLPESVKFCTIVHHIAKGFELYFATSAQIKMFLEGVSKKMKSMKPIRSMQGLKCKPCVEKDSTTKAGKRSFSVPSLVRHFYEIHVKAAAQSLDWRTQMILLPDIGMLEQLPRILASEKVAYGTVADALPWAFGDERLHHRYLLAPGQPDDGKNDYANPRNYQQDSFSHPPQHWGPRTSDPSSLRADLRPSHEVYNVGQANQAHTQPIHREDANMQPHRGDAHYIERPVLVQERGPIEMNPRHAKIGAAPSYPPERAYDSVNLRLQGSAGQESGALVNQGDTRHDRYHPRDPARPEPVHTQTPPRFGYAPGPVGLRDDRHPYQVVRNGIATPEQVPYMARGERGATRPPVEEYELVEVRDPVQGTYYIRRPISRDVYSYEARNGRQQQHYPAPTVSNGGRFDTSRQTVPREELEEYDPRFPAGEPPCQHVRPN